MSPNAELIAGAKRRAVFEDDFQQLFAMNLPAFFVLECRDDLVTLRIDHFTG